MSPHLLFPDHDHYRFEAMRVLGHAAYGGADLGEVLATVAGVTAGNPSSWHEQWTAMGDHISLVAQRSRDGGHLLSARDSHLRAASYYRIADFFLHGNAADPRIGQSHHRSAASFAAHAELAPHGITPVRIPFEGVELAGWFSRAHTGTGPRPLLLLHNGFDGPAQEMHFFGGLAAAERGFHTLSFDGPGQPTALVEHGLPFRPNWETVVSPVLDHILSEYRELVDPDRIALLGLSLGGMLAPRAAAFDPRVAALICVDGIYDASTALSTPLGTDRAGLLRLAADPAGAEPQLAAAAANNPILAWIFEHGQYAFGVPSRVEFLREYLRYHLLNGVAERIRCPTLICEAADDLFFADAGSHPPEPRRLMQHLTCQATLCTFTADEGAAAHSHGGAERLAMTRILDWLEDTLATVPARPAASA
jgi:alpha-beta hydrolase superfamily lysophospholipase